MNRKRTSFITHAAIIAALYVLLTLFSSMLGLDKGAVQFRISEMLTVLPVYTPAAVPGLFVGCLISNMMSACLPWDIVFGSIATLLGALGTYALRKHKFLAPSPPILANSLIVPPVIIKVYEIDTAYPLVLMGVLVGEVVCCGIFGYAFMDVMKKYEKHIFKKDE
jgi:uncharacterized membrane protein